MNPAIVLERRKPEPHDTHEFISGFEFYNPLRDDIFNRVVVATPNKKIDEHYLILLFNGSNCKIERISEVIGVVEKYEQVEQRTYNIAKKLAQERAKKETYGWYNDKGGVSFVDNTAHQRENELELVLA